jgi:penicillin amidase
MQRKIPGAQAPLDIVWDDIGVAHVYAASVADAYRGMGYAAGSERLWQIHLSTAFANGEAAALLGARFVKQDAIQRACNVHGGETALPASEGDWIADAYLDGLNAVVDGLTEVPPEFKHAGAQPRRFTRADIAARYRFTSWFQHKSWTEKIVLGRLMATHGVDYFRNHVLHLSAHDEALIEQLGGPLRAMEIAALELAYPEVRVPGSISGSNNWAVTGAHTRSGKPMLATDPHQPHSIPNTFFYVHLHAQDWDAFGAAFPGVPYFMMGYTRDLAWGLTTGFVDSFDVYVERTRDGAYESPTGWQRLRSRTETIAVKGGSSQDVAVSSTGHGPLLETLTDELGITSARQRDHQTALHWSLTDVPTSAGALARLPLAKTAQEFGDLLFENDVCPLVNNIICIDKADHLRRFIATTLPVRSGVTGSVPLAGWDAQYDFPRSTATSLTVEIDPAGGSALTANNDTMGERGDFYIHNFPANSARADRITELLAAGSKFSVADFQAMQLDLTDLRAAELLPDLLEILSSSDDADIKTTAALLGSWDRRASADAAAPCLYYPFLDRFWPRRFMHQVLSDDLIDVLPAGAPGLNRFDISHFMAPDSPWREHHQALADAIIATMKSVYNDVVQSLGADPAQWRWGDLHQVNFWHTLAKYPTWSHMSAGPDPIGGSGTTLGMAMHMGPGPGPTKSDDIPCRVYHGPAFRLVVDLADPDHAAFVIAGGNGGHPSSAFVANQYPRWLAGEYFTLRLRRDELNAETVWKIQP